jgi:hypothetical protein
MPAAAKVAGHRLVNVGVGRFRVAGQKGRRAHQLPGLAIAALCHLLVDPGLLQHVQRAFGFAHSLHRDHDSGDVADGNRAGTDRLAIDQHRARAASPNAATEFRAGNAGQVAQRPQQRHLGIGIDLDVLAIDIQSHRVSPEGNETPRRGVLPDTLTNSVILSNRE